MWVRRGLNQKTDTMTTIDRRLRRLEGSLPASPHYEDDPRDVLLAELAAMNLRLAEDERTFAELRRLDSAEIEQRLREIIEDNGRNAARTGWNCGCRVARV